MNIKTLLCFFVFINIVTADEICKLSQTPFGELIRAKESRGNYNIYNKPKTYAIVISENISNLSIAEVIDRQLVDKNIHAAGVYQMARVTDKSGTIHSVIDGCATALGVLTTEKFGVKFQDRCFDEYLTTSKKWRGAIHDYFYGNGSIEAAALATAQEWTSMPTKNGTSYYGNGIDKAGTTYENLIATMKLTKEQIQSNQCNPQEQPDNNATNSDNNSTDGNFGDYDDDIGGNVNVGGNIGSSCGGCVSIPAILQSTKTSLLNFKTQEQQTARAVNEIIKVIHYAHQDLEKQNENLAKQTQKLMEEENLVQQELLYNKIRINKLQNLINTKKAEE